MDILEEVKNIALDSAHIRFGSKDYIFLVDSCLQTIKDYASCGNNSVVIRSRILNCSLCVSDNRSLLHKILMYFNIREKYSYSNRVEWATPLMVSVMEHFHSLGFKCNPVFERIPVQYTWDEYKTVVCIRVSWD